MRVQEILEVINQFDPVVIAGKTFEPVTIDQVILESGESVYWAHGNDGPWISIDPESEELIVWSDVEEEVGNSKDTVLYAGDEYEFSYESSARVRDEDGEEELVSWREYEAPSGTLLRVMSFEVTGDHVVSIGEKIAEEFLQLP
jgi:hypothetical protein